MKEMFFISGLPRSGSTMLSSILKQNPEMNTGLTTPMHDLIDEVIRITSSSDANNLISEGKRKAMLQGLFESYYSDVKQPIVFDTCRFWTSKTELLKILFPQTKVICCVRDLFWILDSFERILSKNVLHDAKFTDLDSCETVIDRCDALMDMKKKGQVVRPYYYLEEGLLLNPSMIMLVEYEHLCKNPESIMRGIYKFIDKPYFEHDFDNVEYKNEVFDNALNLKDLHTVRKQVSWIERPSILPRSVFEKYSGKEFWRDNDTNTNMTKLEKWSAADTATINYAW